MPFNTVTSSSVFLQIAWFHSFLTAELTFIMNAYHSSADGHLGWLPFLGIGTSTALNAGVYVNISVLGLRACEKPALEWHGHIAGLLLRIFKEPLYRFPQGLYKFISHQKSSCAEGSLLYQSLSTSIAVNSFLIRGAATGVWLWDQCYKAHVNSFTCQQDLVLNAGLI